MFYGIGEILVLKHLISLLSTFEGNKENFRPKLCNFHARNTNSFYYENKMASVLIFMKYFHHEKSSHTTGTWY